ncbi:hypothetical protein GQ457_13G011680 [Hibiscus cannabinus]
MSTYKLEKYFQNVAFLFASLLCESDLFRTIYFCIGVWQPNLIEILVSKEGNMTTTSYVGFNNIMHFIGDATKNQVTMYSIDSTFDTKRLSDYKFNKVSVQIDTYISANEIFFGEVMKVTNPNDDYVGIHDYYLIALSKICMKYFHRIKLEFLLHSPFLSSKIYPTLLVRDQINVEP